MDKRQRIIQGAKIELARREFFFYCQLKAPDFYKDDRKFLICDELQAFIESNEDVCVVNIPPRHGKSRTAGNLVEWLLGNDNNMKIMTGSYNETLSTMFSKNVRNSIQEEKADENKPVFADVFPGTKIKYGDGAMNLWSLEGGYNILIIMTRWHSNDLAGRVLKWCEDAGKKYRHIKMRALQNKETHIHRSKHMMISPEMIREIQYLLPLKTIQIQQTKGGLSLQYYIWGI